LGQIKVDILSNVLYGFQVTFYPTNLLYCFIGVFIGTLIGVLPGIGPVGAMAILLPSTFHVPPVSGVIMLAGIYYGAMWLGERIFNLEKCFNVLHTKWTREDDLPQKRFTSKPLNGKFKIDIKSWEQMLDRYYDLHGWDKMTGKPLKETLKRLNLNAIQTRLEQNGKLF
jgi:hypothetical protein